jgi:2-polyprenyl-3-methyl-5-hydroxy-6-metoxy-1,4-benzoquinol methylase
MKEKPSYALDIGSGFGYFLRALEEKNYRAMGIELSKDAADIANKKGPSKTLHGDLRSLFEKRAIGRDQFSLITLWDVIEHFYDFNEDLDIVSAVLSSKGYVALRTNNIESIEFDVLGPYFHRINQSHQTFLFSSKSHQKINQNKALMR